MYVENFMFKSVCIIPDIQAKESSKDNIFSNKWIQFDMLCLFKGVVFKSRSGEVCSIQRYLVKFVSDLRQVGGFLCVLRFPPPIKLTTTI